MGKIYTSAEQLIGGTPLLELTHLERELGLSARILGKLESFNPGGAPKDRIAKSLLDDGEARGILKSGSVIIEPTSGNTGIGLASVAAARGYRIILVMPDTMSVERRQLMKAYGAELVLTEGSKGMKGAIEKAAELAYRDAVLSHVKNGVYGAMFCAAMISAAFCERDAERIVEAGLAQIPRNCRLTQDVRQAMAIARSSATAEELLDRLWQAFEHYDPVHTNNNAALCAAVLLFAGDDYEKGITTAVLGGWDTDCNGATVGSILGAKLGASAIPAHWTEPLHDTLYSAIPGFHPIAIRECARRSKALSDRYLLTGKGE